MRALLRPIALACVVAGGLSCGTVTSPRVVGADSDAGDLGDIVERDDGSVRLDVPPLDGPLRPAPTTYDFIVSGLNFYVPEGLAPADEVADNPCGLKAGSDNTRYKPLRLEGLLVDGFDLDGADGERDGPCGHTDFVNSDGVGGIDYAFLHVMDMIRPARPGQTIQFVLDSAPKQGLVKIGIRLSGVDDILNDDDVELLITNTAERPLLGTDGAIIPGSSVAALDDPAFQTRMRGAITDGVLEAGPADVAIGHINLLVVQDRVVSLRGARLRATVSIRPDGAMVVDSLLGGWWEREALTEAIGRALLTIGANRGELDCVLDAHMDHSLGGEACDAMSMIFHVQSVSGFITGLGESAGGE